MRIPRFRHELKPDEKVRDVVISLMRQAMSHGFSVRYWNMPYHVFDELRLEEADNVDTVINYHNGPYWQIMDVDVLNPLQRDSGRSRYVEALI